MCTCRTHRSAIRRARARQGRLREAQVQVQTAVRGGARMERVDAEGLYLDVFIKIFRFHTILIGGHDDMPCDRG